MAKDIATTVGTRQAREEFLAVGALKDDLVAPGVLNSWRRSRALHVHPDRIELPYVRDPDPETPLILAAARVLRRIASDLAVRLSFG